MATVDGLLESTRRGAFGPVSAIEPRRGDAADRGVVEAKGAEVGRQIDGLQPESGGLAVQLACQRRPGRRPRRPAARSATGGGILVRRHQNAVVVLGSVVG